MSDDGAIIATPIRLGAKRQCLLCTKRKYALKVSHMGTAVAVTGTICSLGTQKDATDEYTGISIWQSSC